MTDAPSLDIAWPLPPGEAAAIAVSGGADSFALLAWAAEKGHPVVALTVDHGLREGSAAEAQAVRTWCSERNIPHETLIWRGEKPSSGIQAAAREARYRLLCQACERMGIEHLITAHTADDQAETVFIRLRRGAGRGLAGIRPERKIAAGPGEPITLHRPMLAIRRSEARSYAEASGLPFVDDPSNDDERFERVRVRALLAALEQQDLLTAEALCRTAAHLEQDLSDIADVDVSGGLAYGQELRDDASICFSRWEVGTGEGGDYEGRARLAGAAIKAVSGSAVVPSEVPFLPRNATASCGGSLLIAGDGRLSILREPAALLGRADGTPGLDPVPAPPGSKHLYDRRFIVTVPDDAPGNLQLRPLGQLMPRDIVQSTIARQRIATLPCLAEGDRLAHLPEQAVEAVTNALGGWKQCDSFLPTRMRTFPARSLLAERFAGDVIRY